MSLYYQDDYVTLHHGDSLEVLPTLDIQADALLTDPPYFKVKQEEWDNQWDKAHEFLEWMGDFLDAAKPTLTQQASVFVFASPVMTSSVERLVGERFRVLNSIRWVKDRGTHRRNELAALRSFLSPWEGIVFAEQKDDIYDDAARRLHIDVFAPLGSYFKEERERAGYEANDIEVKLGFVRKANPLKGTELYRRWEEGSTLPNELDYRRLQALDGDVFQRTYSSLQQQYEALKVEFETQRKSIEHLRRTFNVSERKLAYDVWTGFESVAHFPGKHPCEKPEALLRHMIEVSTRQGETILDPFVGSGSTLLAASRMGRRAIGVEKDERWCEHAANRLSQGTFDIFAAA